MALVVTKFTAYGIEAEEPLQKRFQQHVLLEYTAAATDATIDIGNYTGTFWTAAGGTTTGAIALKALKDIQIKAKSPDLPTGLGLVGKYVISGAGGNIISYDSAASLGGAATEAVAVTGLAVADTILSVSQVVKGANSTALNGWTDGSRTANLLTLSWTANPGANSVSRVLVRKAAAAVTPVAGQYSVLLNATNTMIPDITFASADAPTTARLWLRWWLKDNEWPEQVYSAA